MTNERKKHILWFLFFCFLLFAITAFASGCACKDQSIVGIKVMVEDQEITEVTKVVKVQGKTNFDLTQAIKVYSIYTNGEEKPVLSKNENGKGFEIVASLPNPLTAGAYDLVVKYEDYGSVKFRLVIEMGLNQIKNVSNLSKPYDGLPVASPTFDLDFEQETKIEYFMNTGYTLMPLTSAPTNAGNYFVKITALANNFAVQSVFNSAFVISKITPIEVSSHPSFNLEYSSTRTLADLTLNPGYSWINASETPTAQKNRYEALYNPDPINYNNLITNVTVNTSKIVVDVPNPNLDYTYNGEIQTFDIAENPAYEITNNTRKDAGYQQVTVSLKDNQNFIWSSLSANDLIFTFEIKKQTPILPEIKTIYANAYDSFSDIDLPQGLSWNKENGENVGKLGNKTFFATFTPTDTTNYETIEGIEINIVVTSVVRIPKQADEILEFNGDEQSLTLENLDKELVEISGTTKATLSGEYTLVASLKYPDLTMWTDGTTENKTIKWTINKIQIELIARTDGSYSSENLTKSFNGNHFYYNSNLTNPYGFNFPFEIIRKSTQQNITNEFFNSNLGSFEFVENENCENGYIKLFSNQTLTQTTATIGTSYAGITYALKNCANYGLGKEDKQQLIFEITIKKAILNFSSTLYAGNANFNNTLQAIKIISNNAKVYAYLSKEENQIATETTYIDGTWAWENPNTPLLESGKHTAIFYPSQNAENFETLKTQIQVDITINDGISSTIQIGDNTPIKVTRNGNVFSHLSNVANQTHTIKFTLPANTTATYSINGSSSENYSNENGIVLDDLESNPIYSQNYEIKISISGEIEKELIFLLTIEQSECEIFINNKEWDGVSSLKTGDKIEVNLLNSATANKVKINDTEQTSYVISASSGLMYVELLNNENLVLKYGFNINYISPFESIALDENQSNYSLNYLSSNISIGFSHQLLENQNTINIDFKNQNISNLVIKYSLDNQNFVSLDLNTTTISNLKLENTDKIYINICINDITIASIYITLTPYTLIQNIKYRKIDDTSYISNNKFVYLDSFLKEIIPNFHKENLEYEILNQSGAILDLNNLNLSDNLSFEFTLKIFDENKQNLLEEQSFTVNFHLYLHCSDNENCTLSQDSTRISVFSKIGTEFSMSLNNESNNITLKIFNSDGNPIENNIIISNENQQFTYEITNAYNNQKITGVINVLISNEKNILDAFTSNQVEFTLPNAQYSKVITLESGTLSSLSLEANYELSDVITSLTEPLNNLLKSSEYSLTLSSDTQISLITISVKKNNAYFTSVYIKVYLIGEKNNNTQIQIETYLGVNDDEPQISFNEQEKEYTITNIKSSSRLSVRSENSYCELKLYYAENIENLTEENLVMTGNSILYFDYDKNGTYIVEITSTDKTKTDYYFIHINGTLEPFISVTINDNSYDTNILGDNFTGFFQIQDENDEVTLCAKLSKDMIQDKTHLEIMINTFATFTLTDQNNTAIPKNQKTALQIMPATLSQLAYVAFNLVYFNNQTITCFIYFE